MKIGLGIGVTKPQGMPVGLSQSPAGLFTAGEQGAWYDPSDINLTWRRNLLTYTEQFDNAAWVNTSAAVTLNATTAPDGTLTGDLLVENTDPSANHSIFQSKVATNGTTYTYSVYLKYAGKRYVVVDVSDAATGGCFVYVDLIGGSITQAVTKTGSWVAVGASITGVGNGWYKVSVSGTLGANNLVNSYVWLANSSTGPENPAYTGDGTSGIYIWGAQLELGSTATPYQRITDGVQDYLQYQAQPVLYQDAAGTTPVTAVEQPVGLMLDKSKGLVPAPELVTNGDFSNGTIGWTGSSATLSVSNGALVVTPVSGNGTAYQAITTVIGKTYVITITLVTNSGTPLLNWGMTTSFAGGSQLNLTGYPSGSSVRFQFTAAATTTYVGFACNPAYGTNIYDNISVRELPGNHAFQPTSANRLTLSARYNLLTKTEDFSDAVWTKAGTSTAPSPNTLNFPALNEAISQVVSTTATVGTAATFSVELSGSGTIYIGCYRSTGAAYEEDRLKITLTATPTRYSVSHTIINAGQTGFGGYISRSADGTATTVTANKAQLIHTNDALNQPAYQRVNTSTDYDTVGFKPYLVFNGTSSSMQTNSIDFTYGDKMFVCAGVRKIGTSISVPVELSANADTAAGAFNIGAPVAADLYYASLRGSSQLSAKQTPATFPSPITSVVQVSYALSQPSATDMSMRVNAVSQTLSVASSSPGPAGAGNFGNYPLYLGARGGSSFWFNGRLYGMVIRGAETNSTDIYKTEDYLNTKTRAYFPNTLFLESGENLLQEDGSYIILES